LGSDEANQYRFGKNLFHIVKPTVSIDFAHKKNLFSTGFAHRKFILWKSGGLGFQIFRIACHPG